MSQPIPPFESQVGETRAGDDLLAELADDFLRRHRAGEKPSLDEYAQKHPELSEAMRDLFPAMLAMEQPGLVASVNVAPPEERMGATIGRYKLLERIGEGGFGVVYMAEQQQPVRRRVALKVIKPGFDTKQVIARFEAERQTLALMDHPNIATVLDGGATGSGRPYFVMELVHGVPITEYCDANSLAPRDRLELFIQVCRAVQHAHTKGIIHRDIKPTNVLVTLHEGVAVPKVIDFGVAKATGQQLTDKTLFTNFAQMVGTPLYMSPEQAEMTSIDVDTRSDVYSLGVLLYELLTGTTPLDKERLKQAAFDEVRRIIREEDPPRPSTRLSTLGEQLRTISARRKSDPRRLGQVFRGELDWIVMKALEKDRSRRYETANGLAMDVQRYLADEPVQAGPPGPAYKLRKFVKRHRGAVVAATLLLLALVGGVTGTSLGLVAAEKARNNAAQQYGVAVKNEADAKAQLDRAEKQLNRAEWFLYASRINLAQQAWDGNNVTLAMHYLNLCRTDFRGWEYDYLHTLFTHNQQTYRGPVKTPRSLVVSRNGKLAASGDQSALGAKVWDVAKEKELHSLVHPDHVCAVAFNHDGTRLATATCALRKELIKVWDTATGDELLTIDHAGFGLVAFSRDGTRIAGGGPDKSLKIWDAATGNEITTVGRNPAGTSCLAFSLDGRRLVTGSYDNAVRVYDLSGEKEPLVLQGHTRSVLCVAFSVGGKNVASGSFDGTARVWDLATGRERFTLTGHTGGVTAVAYRADGWRIATAGDDKTIRLWHTINGRQVHILKGHEVHGNNLCFSEDGQRLFSCGGDGVVKVWDLTTDTDLLRYNMGGINSIVHTRDGKIISGHGDGKIRVWDPASGKEIKVLADHRASIAWLVISQDGKRLVSGGYDRMVRVWEYESGREIQSLAGDVYKAETLAIGPDGHIIATTGGAWEAIIWDSAGQEIRRLKPRAPIHSLAFDPNGRFFVTGLAGSVKTWDVATGNEIRNFPGHSGPVNSLAVSRDGRRIISGGQDNTIRMWDTQTGAELLVLREHTGPIDSVRFSVDEKRIFSGSRDRTMKVWDAASGTEVLTLPGNTQPGIGSVNVLVSPDGRRIFGIGSGQVQVWDAGTRDEKP